MKSLDHYTLARAYHATGQSEQAATTERKALDLIPTEMVQRREVYAARLRDYEAASQMRTN
jgi:hypothetical protein